MSERSEPHSKSDAVDKLYRRYEYAANVPRRGLLIDGKPALTGIDPGRIGDYVIVTVRDPLCAYEEDPAQQFARHLRRQRAGGPHRHVHHLQRPLRRRPRHRGLRRQRFTGSRAHPARVPGEHRRQRVPAAGRLGRHARIGAARRRRDQPRRGARRGHDAGVCAPLLSRRRQSRDRAGPGAGGRGAGRPLPRRHHPLQRQRFLRCRTSIGWRLHAARAPGSDRLLPARRGAQQAIASRPRWSPCRCYSASAAARSARLPATGHDTARRMALRGLAILARMDREKEQAGQAHWTPSLRA